MNFGRLGRRLFAPLILVGIIFIFSCEIGLGAAVDVAVPTSSITYPPENAVVRGTFTAAGECDDDMKISSVQVSLFDPLNNVSFGPYEAILGAEGKTWTVSLNKKDSSKAIDIFSSYKQWEIPDGNYLINAIAYDQNKKESPVASSPISIDNTAPVLVVSKPMGVGADAATVYGRSLKLSGDISEDHDTSKLVLYYREYDESTGVFTGSVKTIEMTDSAELNAMSSSNPLIIAQYSGNSTQQHDKYIQIHGNNPNLTKYYYAGFMLEDNARLYVNPGDNGSGIGNQTEQYYLLGSDYQNILAVKYSLTAAKLKEMLKGQSTAYSADDVSKIIESLSKEGNFASSIALEKEGDAAKPKSSKFSLNPHNNPTWALDGYGVSESDTIQLYTAGSSLILTLKAGRDASYPDPKTVKVRLYDLVDDTDDATTNYFNKSLAGRNSKLLIGEEGEGDAKEIGVLTSLWDEAADDPTKTYTFVLNTDNDKLGLTANHIYRLEVSGTDRNITDLEPKDDKAYIFRLSTSNSAPKVTITEVTCPGEEAVEGQTSDPTFGTTVNDSGVVIKGFITTDGVPLRDIEISKIEVQSVEGGSIIFNKDNFITDNIEKGTAESNNYPFTINLTKSGSVFVPAAESKYSYQVFVQATDNNDSSSTEKPAKFYVDNKKPDVRITSVTPSAGKEGTVTVVNGKITVSGSASDSGVTGSGLKALSYDVIKNGSKEKTGDFPENQVNESWSIEIPTRDLDDLENYTIEVTATDKKNNKKTSEAYEIKLNQSTDTPVFNPTNADVSVIDETDHSSMKKNMFNTTGNNKLSGYMTDDDGIGSVLVECTNITTSEKITLSSTGFEKDSKRFDFSYPLVMNGTTKLPQGKYEIKVTIKDSNVEKGEAFKESDKGEYSKTFIITIDDGAPTFNIKKITPSDLSSAVYLEGNTADGTAETIVVEGTITDPNGIRQIDGLVAKHYIKKSNGEYVEDTSENKPVSEIVLTDTNPANPQTKNFKDTITRPKASGTYKVVYIASDVYDQQASYEVEYSVDVKEPKFNKVIFGSDSNSPEITGTELASGKSMEGWINDNSVFIQALVEDPKDAETGNLQVKSGIKEVKYYLDGDANQLYDMSRSVSATGDVETWTANVTFADGLNKEINFIAYDSVGKDKTTGSIKINIDKTPPVLDMKGYKVAVDASGTEDSSLIPFPQAGKLTAYVYQKDLVLYGNYSDDSSGVKDISSLFKIGNNSITLKEIHYYSEKFAGSDDDSINSVLHPATGSYEITIPSAPADFVNIAKDIKAFVAVIENTNFTADGNLGDLIISGISDYAGNPRAGETKSIMTLKKDLNNPLVSGVQILKEDRTAVYKSNDGTYYLRNKSDLNKSDGKITIKGNSYDQEELDKTEITISGSKDGSAQTIKPTADSKTSWSFNNIDLDKWSDEATVSIKAYDKAGRYYEYPDITIKFDVQAPEVLTKDSDPADESNPYTDVYNFHDSPVEKYYNIKVSGGAYSESSYGKDSSKELTVTFIKENTGSGIKKMEYKMLNVLNAEAYKDIPTGTYSGSLPSSWTAEDEFTVSADTYTRKNGTTGECYIGKATINDFESTTNGTPNLVFFRAEDNCGNVSDWFVLRIQVDNKEPLVNENLTLPSAILTNGENEIKLFPFSSGTQETPGNIKETGAGIKAVRVYIDDDVVIDGDLKNISEKTGFSKTGNTVTLTNSDSNKTLTITAKDKDGNAIDPTSVNAVEVYFENKYGTLSYTGYIAEDKTKKCSFANAASYAEYNLTLTPKEGNWFNTINKPDNPVSPKIYIEVEDWAEDAAHHGNITHPVITSLNIDTTKPVVSLLGPDSSKDLNGKQTIRGSVKEAGTLKYVKLYSSTAVTVPEKLSDWGEPFKVITTVPEVYNFNFEKDYNSFFAENSNGGSVYILIYTEDEAGNTNVDEEHVTALQTTEADSKAYRKYTVDKNSDRPIVTVKLNENKNLKPEGQPLASDNCLMLETSTLNLNVVDDDGIKKIEYRIAAKGVTPTEADWKDDLIINQDSTSVKFVEKDASNNIIVLEGEHKLEFRITDKENTVFTSSGSRTVVNAETGVETEVDCPKIYLTDKATTPNKYGTTETGYEDPTLYVNIDTKPPVVKIEAVMALKEESQIKPDTEYKSSGYSNMILGGPGSKFLKVKISASDDGSGIDKVELSAKLKGVAVSETKSADANNSGIYELIIPCTRDGIVTANENLDVTAKAKDKAGKTYTDSITIKIDNKEPDISITAPDTSKIHSGSIIAEGSIYEESTVYYAISPIEDSPDTYNALTPFTFKKYDKDMNETEVTLPAKNKAETKVIQPAEALKDLCAYKPLRDDGVKIMSFALRFDGEAGSSSDLHSDSLNQWIKKIGITNEEDLGAIGNAAFNDTVKLYLHIKAVDSAGNIKEEKREILLDPQGNRPKVTIGYPSEAMAGPDTNGLTLGGAPSIIGTASGTNGVDFVWMQIDTNEDSKWDYNDFNTLVIKDDESGNKAYAFYDMKEKDVRLTEEVAVNTDVSSYAIKIPVSGLNWNQTINKAGELFSTDQANSLKGTTIWVYATDSAGFTSTPEVRKLIIDRDSPVISQDLWLVQWKEGKNGGNGFTYNSTTKKIEIASEATTAIRAYNDNEKIRGKWYLLGYVSDDSGIGEIDYSVNKGINNKPVSSDENGYINDEYLNTDGSGTYIRKVEIEGKTGTYNYLFCFPIGEENSVNTYTIDFSADEMSDASQPASAPRTFTVTYDNNPPEFGEETILPTITNSNGVYGFGGFASELPVNGVKQTGVERVAFYFTRDINKQKTTIFDPMIKSGKTGNAVDYSTLPLKADDEDSFGLYWQKAEINSVNYATVELETSPSINVHVGGLAKVNGVIYRVEGVDSTDKKISLSGEPGNASEIFFAIANVVDNPTNEGEGTAKIEREDGYGYGYYSNGNFDDNDFMVESLIGKDNNYEWKANINSKNMSDGPVTLHYVVFDKAGNATEVKEISCIVRNNAPRLAGVTVGTDVNGDGDLFDDNETFTDYARNSTITVAAANKYTSLTVPSGVTDSEPDSLLKIKGRTIIQPEIVGGNGKVGYTYTVAKRKLDAQGKDANNGWDNPYKSPVTTPIELGTGSADDYTSSFTGTIDLSVLDILKAGIEDGENQKFEFNFLDSTPGLDKENGEAGIDSQSASMNLIMDVALRDATPAKNKIIPFYWKNKDNNSLAGNSTSRGHIELTQDLLSASFKSTNTGIYDLDPKVSGAFKLEGIAQDDSLLKNLYVTINNGTEKIYHIGTYENGAWVEKTGTYTSEGKTITYKNATITQATYGEFMAAGYITALPEGKKADDTVLYASQEYGHVVHWTLEIDTETMGLNPKENVVITVSAEDKGKPKLNDTETAVEYKPNDFTNNGDGDTPDQTGESKYTCKYKIDVVPYIRGIKTKLSTKSKKSDSSEYDRTALGHYPVKNTEIIYLYGFNLKGTANGILYDSTKNAAGNPAPESATLGNATTIDNIESYKGYQLYATAADAIKAFTSGPVYVTVDGIKSLNNENDNNAKGSYTDATFTESLTETEFTTAVNNLDANGGNSETYKNFYNRKPNAVNNNVLTDDIELDVWEFNSEAAMPDTAGRIDEPTMRINPKSGIIGFSFLNGSINYSAPGKNLSYRTMGKGTGDGYTNQYDFHSTSTLAYDYRGWSYSLDAGGNEKDPVQLTIANADGTVQNRIKIEHTSQKGLRNTVADNSTNSDIRYKVRSPSIVTSPNGTNANIYMAYYDSFNDEIRYRTGVSNALGLFVNDNDGNDYYSYSCKNAQVIATDKTTNLPSTISYNGDPLGGAGEFVCIDVIPANTKANSAAKDIVVIVWYEAATGNLLYAYNTTPGDYSWKNDNTISNQDYRGLNSLNWNGKKTIFTDAGEYCKIAVDGKGGIHIAAYDSKAGDLRYAYLPTYSSTYTEATMSYTVDSYKNTGSHLTMDVALVDDIAVPYISYIGSDSPKLAYLKANATGTVNDMFTGKWEVTYLPTTSDIPDLDAKKLNNLDNRINVGVWKKSETKNNVTTNGILDKSKTGTNKAETNKGTCWGNGTSNPVLSYSIAKDTSNDRIETAQKR